MRPPERLVFDFETNAWVLADAFNVRAQGREFVLAAPEGEPAPGRWSRPKSPPKKSSTASVVVIGLIAGAVSAVIFLQNSLYLLPALALLIFADIKGYVLRTSTVPTRAEDLRLFEDLDDPDVCLIALTIVRDGKVVGTDRGVAWFADGCLLYSGHRTSFAIGGEDVLTRPDASGEWLALRVPHGAASVSLTPLVRNTDVGGKQEMRFLKALYHFRRRPPQSRIPRQWPPFES